MINDSKIINIFGTTYTIEYVDKIEVDNPNTWRFGEEDASNHTIQICTKFRNGGSLSKSEIEKNLVHELIHAILDEGQFFEESSNEPLVEWLARCLHSIHKQGVL